MVITSSAVEERVLEAIKESIWGGEDFNSFEVKQTNSRDFNYEKSRKQILGLSIRELELTNKSADLNEKYQYLLSSIDFECNKVMVKAIGGLISYLLGNIGSLQNPLDDQPSNSLKVHSIENYRM